MNKKNNLNRPMLSILLVGLTTYIGLITAIKTPIMGDEALTLFLGTLPSLSDLYQGLKLGADSHGPAYHSLNWAYQSFLFGDNRNNNFSPIENMEIYTRLPSIFFFCIAISIVFLTLNKQLPTAIAFFLALTLLYSAESLRHIAEIRSYSLLMLTIAVSFWSLICYQEENKIRYLILLSIGMLFGGLSHPLAALYIGALGGTYIVFHWVLTHHLDKSLLVALAIPILPYLFWLAWGNNQVASTLAENIKWERPPTLKDFFEFTAPSIFIILLMPLIFKAKKEHRIFRASNYPLWFGLSFLAIAMGLWAASQFTNPLFLERYIWPLQLGWIMVALGIFSNFRFSKKDSVITILGCMIMTGFILTQKNPSRASTGGFWSKNPWVEAGFATNNYLTEDIPVACESSTTYLPLKLYFGNQNSIYMVLDSHQSEVSPNIQNSKGIDQFMNRALSNVDPRQNIVPIEDFLKKHGKFYLLNETFINTDENWLFPNEYKRTLLNTSKNKQNQTFRIELVERIEQ